jgi:hypothetical protein
VNYNPDDFVDNNFTKIGKVMLGADNIDRKAILSFKQAFAHARSDTTQAVVQDAYDVMNGLKKETSFPSYISVHKFFGERYRNYSLCLKGHGFDKISQVFGKILHMPSMSNNDEEIERE